MKLNQRKKFILHILLVVTLVFASCQGTVLAAGGIGEEITEEAKELGYVPGEILVAYEQDTPHGDISVMAQECDSELEGVVSTIEDSDVVLVEIPEDLSVEEAIEWYESDPKVLFAQPNYLLYAMEDKTNDPMIRRQSYLNADNGTTRRATNMFAAWDEVIAQGYQKVKVAVIDTGADYTHEDLSSVINRTDSAEIIKEEIPGQNIYLPKPLKGDDYVNGEDEAKKKESHGTRVTGILAAQANNEVGIAGAASLGKNDLIDVFVIDAFSGDNVTNVASLLAGLDYASAQGAQVINLSLGVSADNIPEVNDQAIHRKCRELHDKGIAIVCAAGNTSGNVTAESRMIPAAYEETIAVINTTMRGVTSSNSCYGSIYDVCAPGESIYSTIAGNAYDTKGGTSFSTPQVTAIVAMLYGIDPNMTPDGAKDILRRTATDLGEEGVDEKTAYGLVNAQEAVKLGISQVSDDGVKIYRLYNPNSGEHLFTPDAKEKEVLSSSYGWKYEGVAWCAPKTGTSVYRLFNPKQGNHLYTSDETEVEILTTRYGWRSDFGGMPLFYSGGNVAIYRLFNPNNRIGSHHWTTDKVEYDILPNYNWQQEGMAFLALRKGE